MNLLGSQTAKNGFKNEYDICNKFNNWQYDSDARQWLEVMGYNINQILHVNAKVLHGVKSDVSVEIKLENSTEIQNIQVKLVSNKKGFNQVDKRWLKHYKQMWDIPDDVFHLLQYYTGEVRPYKANGRDKRRMFLDEFSQIEQEKILHWFKSNKNIIINDIIKGRGELSAQWVLVAQKIQNRWILVNINQALEYYSSGDVKISPKGSLYIGRVTVQRKGGDGGRNTANMLQFKLDPAQLFEDLQ